MTLWVSDPQSLTIIYTDHAILSSTAETDHVLVINLLQVALSTNYYNKQDKKFTRDMEILLYKMIQAIIALFDYWRGVWIKITKLTINKKHAYLQSSIIKL